jgi:hypothetical protein
MRFYVQFLVVMTALASLASPLAAASISYVTTLTSILAGGVDNNYDSVTGLSQNVGNCYLSGGGTGPCATLSSNPAGNTLGLTAASVSIGNGVSYDPNNGISAYGAASASANLATGVLGAYASGPNCSTPNASGCDSSGTAIAEMQDSLTFTNTSGVTQDIDVNWSFDGTTVGLGTFPSTVVTSLFCFGPGTICGGNPNSGIHTPLNAGQSFMFSYQDGSVLTNSAPTTPGWVSTGMSPGANATSETFYGVFAVPAGVSTDSLNAYLDVACQIATCDFSHTRSFSLGALPSGVTFSSASGVLLTDSVPEPETWALSLCAGALLALRRKRSLTAKMVLGA